MSHANNSKSFKDASINAILTLSLETTLDYSIGYGGTVVWPSSTNIAFLAKFPSILMSNNMCTFTCSYTGLIFPYLVS